MAIIIVSWNSWTHLESCLAALQKITYPNGEIVVVDNASVDGSADCTAAVQPTVALIRNRENLGSAGGNNVGMRYALAHGADHVWLLNTNAEPEPDSVALLVEEAVADPGGGIVAPVLSYFHDRQKVQNCGALVDWEGCRMRHLTDLALLEAMAHRLPVVASDATSMPEIIADRVHGLLFPSGNCERLTQTLIWALEHPEEIGHMAERVPRRTQDFTEEKMPRRTLEWFESPVPAARLAR